MLIFPWKDGHFNRKNTALPREGEHFLVRMATRSWAKSISRANAVFAHGN